MIFSAEKYRQPLAEVLWHFLTPPPKKKERQGKGFGGRVRYIFSNKKPPHKGEFGDV